MNFRFLAPLAIAASMGCAASQTPSPTSTKSVPAEASGPALQPAEKGAYFTGQYRNVFVERGKPAAEVQAKVERAYESLFHGDFESEAVLFEAGENDDGALAYIKDIGNGDVRSEGMSYGMMIAVQMDRKQDFDAIWNWAMTHMYHADETHPVHGFFSWQVGADGKVVDEMPAPDGEEYFATALLFADHRWGSGEGIYDYRTRALELLSDMKNREPITGIVNGDKRKTGVALFNPDNKIVRFTPDTENFEKNGDHTDPSYHLPAFYELWAQWGPEADREFWKEAAGVSRDFLIKTTHPKTGLAPDYANFDGSPKAASWDAGTANFRYDAWRTVMNWAVDYAWFAADERQIELSDRLLGFFASHGKSYPNLYEIDGTPLSQSTSMGLISANAVAALAATHPRTWQFVDDIYARPVPTGQWRYYDGMLYMMAMLHLSGNFRVHMPKELAAR